jgi:hypothetical protein
MRMVWLLWLPVLTLHGPILTVESFACTSDVLSDHHIGVVEAT